MSRVLIVAPHPDDETLGAGGTLLRHRDAGDEVHWLVATAMRTEDGYDAERIAARRREMDLVEKIFGFAGRHELALPPARLDTMPLADIVAAVARVVRVTAPEIAYLPHPGDAHSDHAVMSDAAAAALKWFRAPSVKRILTYETLSETGFNLDPAAGEFRPNWYVDISATLAGKLDAVDAWGPEIGTFPFPRSREAVEALARLRGTASGCPAAEAFMLLKGIET